MKDQDELVALNAEIVALNLDSEGGRRRLGKLLGPLTREDLLELAAIQESNAKIYFALERIRNRRSSPA